MNTSQADNLKTAFGWIFGAGFAFVGIIFLALGGYEFWQGLQTKNWPETPGRIVESEVESKSSSARRYGRLSRRDSDFSVKLRYSYEVAGRKLEGQRLQYGYESHDERESAKQEQSRYPVGKEVQVFYDLTNPERSVLVKGGGTSWLAIGLGLAALVLGSVTMVYMARARRAGTHGNMPAS